MDKDSPLILSLLHESDSERKKSGKSYFQSRLTRIIAHDSNSASLHVVGTKLYIVDLFWYFADSEHDDEATLSVYCSCPDYNSNNMVCKHIFASIYHWSNICNEFKYFESNFYPYIVFSTHPRSEIENPVLISTASKIFDDPLIYKEVKFTKNKVGNSSEIKRPHSILRDLDYSLQQLQNKANLPESEFSKAKELIEIWYELDRDSLLDGRIEINLYKSVYNLKTNRTTKLKALKFKSHTQIFKDTNFAHAEDFYLISKFFKIYNQPKHHLDYNYYYRDEESVHCSFSLSSASYREIFLELLQTRRFFISKPREQPEDAKKNLLSISSPANYFLSFQLLQDSQSTDFQLSAYINQLNTPANDPSRVAINDFLVINNVGFAIDYSFKIYFLEPASEPVYVAIKALKREGPMRSDAKVMQNLASNLQQLLPRNSFDFPPEFILEQVSLECRPKISLLSTPQSFCPNHVFARIEMMYGDQKFSFNDLRDSWQTTIKGQSVIGHRLRDKESEYFEELCNNIPSIKRISGLDDQLEYHASVPRHELVNLALEALSLGWRVDLEGQRLRSSKEFQIKISSGIDWFEIDCKATFDNVEIEGVDLLKAFSKKRGFITLGDGSLGVIQDESFSNHLKILERFAEAKGDNSLRISKLNAVLLDLESQNKNLQFDKDFSSYVSRVRSANSISAKQPTKFFKEKLRTYQQEGLGWLHYLREVGFGGCLADDMGLGKTIQVLALLEGHHRDLDSKKTRNGQKNTKSSAPSLLIVPKTLIFNWEKEAKKFTPSLKIGIIDTTTRKDISKLCEDNHLIICSYPLLRAEIATLHKLDFEYIVLDEAQQIKNSSSIVSRSVKQLRANHRLALSGTPIENSLDDLASIFEFLNPGMGSSSAFKKIKASSPKDGFDAGLISKLMRPFLLRRTKGEVLKDLPAKTESVLYCDLSESEMSKYKALAKGIRDSLKKEISKVGINKAQIHILSGLTRLRQAACHLGLVDSELKASSSSKLEILLERVTEILKEGHKILIFSQFTEFLKIAQTGLIENEIPFCYLDGQTKDRQVAVEKFNDPAFKGVFLISLKAGGVGLNLTSASYCFLLDPWWNPAAEAQAIDRAHRIGQTNPVFAYRMVAKGTVEEKILELQNNKKLLADSVLGGDLESPKTITMEILNELISD